MSFLNASFLLIDDDDTFRGRLARALRDRSFEVRDTGSPLEGIEIASKDNPTHIVLDLRMPQKGGLEVLRELRTVCSEALVLILTGYGSIATAIEAMKEGATNYLTKPVDLDGILGAFGGEVKASKKIVPSLDQVEWEHLERVMSECNGNISKAAKLLGLHRRSLQRKLKNPPKKA